MHDQAYTVLEYEALRFLVSREAQTAMGQQRVEALVPFDDYSELQTSLAAVGECARLRQEGVRWSFSAVEDPAASISLLAIEGAALEPLALRELAHICELALAARASIDREMFPVLWKVVNPLPGNLHSVVARIQNKILPSGELDDRSSPELVRIRSDISRLRAQIARSLEHLMKRSEAAIQDELVTVRNERFVIPVRADHRGRIQGVAHGFSSSGATAFIEPLETIDANNELQGLREAEQREIFRILLELSNELRAHQVGISIALEVVTTLDFVNAKTIFQERFECVVPSIDPRSADADLRFELVEARHPLLEESFRAAGKAVVPVTFSLWPGESAMVISGANAGGKTVVLKTSGLLSLMALSGLPIPAKRMRIPFYASVLADIGDHQSLAANLSTFTSHVANIARMVDICEPPALVLLDEVGTGTDPEEGSALGVAVVDHFRKACHAHVLATTHYGGLKIYAANESGVLNASVEFDEKTLQPTYRLIIGIAGASSGLEIARRFGIPPNVIESAAALVKDSSLEATEYLRRIKNEAEAATALRAALEEERVAVAEKFATLDEAAARKERERQSQFERDIKLATADFQQKSAELLAGIQERAERVKVEREAQKRAAELKREAQRISKGSSQTEVKAPPVVKVVREGKVLSGARGAGSSDEAPAYVIADSQEISVGDTVKLRTFGSVGVVESLKDDEAEVRVKSLRFREKLENLVPVKQVNPPTAKGRLARLLPSSGTEVNLKETDQAASSELNVIGKTTDEAVAAVDKFLDHAFVSSLSQVRIVHGHGTGALRRAIGDLLRDHPHVEKFSSASPQHGGAGATVVDLRQ